MFIANKLKVGTGITLSLMALGGLTTAIVASKKLKVEAAFECWGLNASQPGLPGPLTEVPVEAMPTSLEG